MNVVVNGTTRDLPTGSTVLDLLTDLPEQGVAVARNGAVVPRSRHRTETLIDGDVLEIVRAVQGG